MNDTETSFDQLLSNARGRRRRDGRRAHAPRRLEKMGRHAKQQPETWAQWGLRTASWSLSAILGAATVVLLAATS